MKSLVNGAPVLPPPPYTWLMTIPEMVGGGVGDPEGEGVGVGVGVSVGVAEGVTDIVGVGEGPPQACAGDAELRGSGAAVVKSVALSLVSVQPPSPLKSANVLLGAG